MPRFIPDTRNHTLKGAPVPVFVLPPATTHQRGATRHPPPAIGFLERGFHTPPLFFPAKHPNFFWSDVTLSPKEPPEILQGRGRLFVRKTGIPFRL